MKKLLSLALLLSGALTTQPKLTAMEMEKVEVAPQSKPELTLFNDALHSITVTYSKGGKPLVKILKPGEIRRIPYPIVTMSMSVKGNTLSNREIPEDQLTQIADSPAEIRFSSFSQEGKSALYYEINTQNILRLFNDSGKKVALTYKQTPAGKPFSKSVNPNTTIRVPHPIVLMFLMPEENKIKKTKIPRDLLAGIVDSPAEIIISSQEGTDTLSYTFNSAKKSGE